MKFPAVLCGILAVSGVLAPWMVAVGQDGPGAPKEAEADQALLFNVDKVPGYGGVVFGADFPAGDKAFEVEQDRGALKIYKKKSEELLMGPVMLETVLYYVFNGKFYGVAFHTNDGQDSLALKGVLMHAFGQGSASAGGGPSTIWIGKKQGALFDLNTATGDGSAFLFVNAIHDEQLKEQSAASKAAAQQLIKGE